MAALVMEGLIPVRYESWREWRAQRIADAQERATRSLVEPHTVPCGHCWGQRRIMRAAPNGEGLIPTLCVPCGGAGRVAGR
jgi:hypothetical protein